VKVRSEVRVRLEVLFTPLHKKAAKGSLPSIGFLSDELVRALDRARKGAKSITIGQNVARAFATAAVDIWSRSVHSFLISCSLTKASPIWASATGYYSSHYSIRAIAHLLGYFQLFRKKCIIVLNVSGGSYSCEIQAKHAADREHRFYWRVVKEHPQFASDLVFTTNESRTDTTEVGHRDRANYSDHVGHIPKFQVVGEDELKQRIAHISQIRFDALPSPRLSSFPDVESVQVVAYHRIVRFRQLLDEGVGVSNRFWSVHRQPSWVGDLMNFQVTAPGGLHAMAN
jgi:hypothetical protein